MISSFRIVVSFARLVSLIGVEFDFFFYFFFFFCLFVKRSIISFVIWHERKLSG